MATAVVVEEKEKQLPLLRILTLHAEYKFPEERMPWSMPTIERHRQIHTTYIVAVASDQSPTTCYLFTAEPLVPGKDTDATGRVVGWPPTPPVSTEAAAESPGQSWKMQYGGTVAHNLPAWMDQYDVLEVFNGTDFWSILKKTWPESEQGLLPWRRKTRELFDTIKKSKACWFPSLPNILQLTPDLMQHALINESQWSSLCNLVIQEAEHRQQQQPLRKQYEYKKEEDGSLTAIMQEEEEEPSSCSSARPWASTTRLTVSVQTLHQLVAVFRRVLLGRLPVFVRRGGRGKNADEVVPVTIAKFQFPVLNRSSQFDHLFQELVV